MKKFNKIKPLQKKNVLIERSCGIRIDQFRISIKTEDAFSYTKKAKKHEFVNKDLKVIYEDLPDNKIKESIIFDKRPESNVINFDITTDNFHFYKQSELTKKEIDEGCIRPDDVINSFAVYNSDDEKVCHIYRPFVVDADEKRVWCDMDIKGSLLSVTIPEKFLKQAKYPIVVDPTIGYDSVGASTYENYQSQEYFSVLRNVVPSQNGETISARIYAQGSYASTKNGRIGLYNLSGELLAQTNLFTAGGFDWDWRTCTWNVGQVLSVGETYYIAWQANGHISVKYDSIGGNNADNIPLTYTDNLPSNLPSIPEHYYGSRRFSVSIYYETIVPPAGKAWDNNHILGMV